MDDKVIQTIVAGIVAVLDKDGNQIAYRCTQPKCENGEYYEEEQEEEQEDW